MLLGPANPMLDGMIVDMIRAATMIRCRFATLCESSNPCSSRPAGDADMNEGSLRELASQPRKLPASVALRASSSVVDGLLLCWAIV